MKKEEIKIPPITADPAVVFFEDERPEEFALYETQRKAAEDAWKSIIMDSTRPFAGAQFTVPGEFGQTLLLTKSVREGVDFQLTFLDRSGEPVMHEDYYLDNSQEPPDIRDSMRQSLFSRLGNYSLRNREIAVTVHYEEKEREAKMEQEKNIIKVQSAVLSNYDGYVALMQFDRDKPWGQNDEKVFLGKRENYDNQGNYDNSDNSLVFISENRKMNSFLYGEGWIRSQQEMIDNGTFTAEDYAEYARLKEGVLKQFEDSKIREVRFGIDMDARDRGEISGVPFRYPDWSSEVNIDESERTFIRNLAKFDYLQGMADIPPLAAQAGASRNTTTTQLYEVELSRLTAEQKIGEITAPYRLVVLTTEDFGRRNAPRNIAYNQVMTENEVAEYRENPSMYLESVYARLGNAGMQPSNYYGHSPSIGDAIVILTPDGPEAHHVAAFGFEQAPDADRVITREQLRTAGLGMTVREEYELLASINTYAHAHGKEDIKAEVANRLDFLYNEYVPVFNLAAIREVMEREQDKLKVLYLHEGEYSVEKPIAEYADGTYYVTNEAVRAAMPNANLVVEDYRRYTSTVAGERLQAEIDRRFAKIADAMAYENPAFLYRHHASPRPLGEQGQYDFFVQLYEKNTDGPGLIPRNIVYAGDAKMVLEVTNHLNASSEYGGVLAENIQLRRQLNKPILMGNEAQISEVKAENLRLYLETMDRAATVVQAMEAAGWQIDDESNITNLVFHSEYGDMMGFGNVPAAEEWLEEVVFDDPEISDAVEKIMHPERFEGAEERSKLMAEQDKIRVAIESTDDYAEGNFHSKLVDDDVQNEDGSYGKVVDSYRIVAINENGRLAAFDDRVFASSEEARAAVAELPGLELVSYDDLVHEAGENLTKQAMQRENNATISFFVAESMEFHGLGEYHEGLTLEQAFEIYDQIPSERLNGDKGIGFDLQDGSMYSGQFNLMYGNEVQEEVINEIDHFRNSPLVQQAIKDCKAEFDRRYGVSQEREVNVAKEEQIRIGEHQCRMVDEWMEGADSYVLGNSIEDSDFYYAIVNGKTANIFEYDEKPSREKVEGDFINLESMRDIDRYEAEFGADGSRAFPNLNDEPKNEDEALVRLAERMDNFMYDYDYYAYADDVGISLEERSEHRAHLADALENNEYSPMIDTFRNIIAEEEAGSNQNSELVEQAKAILHDLTHLEEYQQNYAVEQTGEIRDPMLNLAARLDNFAYDAHPQEYSESWKWDVDTLVHDLQAGNVDGVTQWITSAEHYLTATNDDSVNSAAIREAHDLLYTLQHLDQYQQYYGREVSQNAEHPIQEFVREGRTLEGSQIPGRNIAPNTIGHSDRAAVFHAVQDFEVDNDIPFNQREIRNGTYEDKDFLYMAYDRYVGMSHQNDLSIQPYMERLNAMAEDKSKHISLLPLVAEVYYAQRNGVTPEQIDYILDNVQNYLVPLDAIKNLRHAYENGITQEQIAVLAGEDSFAQENLMGYMLDGGSIENATAMKGCDVAQYYILSSHLNDGSFGPEMAKAIIQAGNHMKDENNKDFDRQKAEGVQNIKWRFSTMDFEFFTEYLAEAAAQDKAITPEMITEIGNRFVEQKETDNLRKFIESNGGFHAFGNHRDEIEPQERSDNMTQTAEDKAAQEGIALSPEKKDPKELLNQQLEQGIRNVLNSENFKNWLDTSRKMYLNNYSFNNAILVWLQKPDATHTMGYEQWKEYGRNVAQGAKGIKIFVPVIAYEKKDGDLWRMIKGNLQKQMKDNPSLPQATFRVGMSKLEFTMNQNGLFGIRSGGKERGIYTEKDMQNFIKHNILGKVPLYFTVGTVFDAKDTIVPEFLWMKKGFTKAEMVKDDKGKPIKNRRGEYKIINTPERQARFQPNLDMSVPQIDEAKANVLYEALKEVSERNGIHVYEKDRQDDDTLKRGADGYYSREFDAENPKGFIVMPTDLDATRRVSVMLHEMSHSELHGNLTALAEKMGEDSIPSKMREIQAEAVAYMVGKNFGIDSDTSSFQYLAAYSQGFELQTLSKSIEVIYNECRQLTKELKTELAVRGLNMDLTERDKVPMDKEAIQTLSKSYVAYAVEQDNRIADIEKELPQLAEQNKGKDTAVAALVAQSVNIQRQKEGIALIKDQITALESAGTLDSQRNAIDMIEAAKARVEDYKKDFSGLSEQFQEAVKNEQSLKDRFVADPVATIKDMGSNMDYAELGALNDAQIQYLAKSEYVSSELTPFLRNDPAQFAERAYERASQIDKVIAKNGMFVEVSFCEQWTDKPIVENGALLHPKNADTIIKQAEVQIKGLRKAAEDVGDYFPYSKCSLTIFQAEKGQINKVFQTRVDIGDGQQSSLTDHLKQISSAKDIVAGFEKATRERNTKDKILFNEPRNAVSEKEQSKEEVVADRAMSREEWAQEISNVREEQAKEREERQAEKGNSARKRNGHEQGKE